jgi:hypothetical protein
MTVTSVTTDNFIKETVLFVRDLLTAKVSDPLSGKRQVNEKFVLTSYPERPVNYPLITVRKENLSSPKRLGFLSQLHLLSIPLEIKVWARNIAEKDKITQDVINSLRSNQTSSSGSIKASLYGFEINSCLDIDNEGVEGLKSSVTSVEYKFILGS